MDPGAVLFVNENLGGHASMHLFLRDALTEVHPGLDARLPRRPRPGLRSAGPSAAQLPVLGPLDLDLHPLRFQLAQSEVARRLLRSVRGRARPPGRPPRLHPEHRVAERGLILRSFPSVVSTDATFLQGAYHLPHRRPTRFTSSAVRVAQRVRAPRSTPPRRWSSPSPSGWPTRLRRAYGIADDRIRVDPVRAERRSGAGTPRPPIGLPEITFVGAHAGPEGRAAAAAGLPGAPARPLRAEPGHPRTRCAPEPGVRRALRLRARRPPPAGAARPHRRSSRSPPRWTTRPYSVLEAMRAGVPGGRDPRRRAARDGRGRRHGPARHPRRRGPRAARSARCSTTRPAPRRWARRGRARVEARLRRPRHDRAAARRAHRGPRAASPRRWRHDHRRHVVPTNDGMLAGGRLPGGRTSTHVCGGESGNGSGCGRRPVEGMTWPT